MATHESVVQKTRRRNTGAVTMLPWTILAALFLTSHPGTALADGACPDPGHLRQTVLVILRFAPEGRPGALTPAEESHIDGQLDAASAFFWTHSNQSLAVDFHTVKVLDALEADDYQTYASGAAAKYTRAMHDSLGRRRINPERYAGVIMIYRPTNAPSGLFNNTWVYYNDTLAGTKRQPGFSSVLFDNTAFLSEIVVHEYLHQLDHRFETESGNPDSADHGFLNTDHMNQPTGQQLAGHLGTTFSTPMSYYMAMLKYHVGDDGQLHPVNYRWLDGIRGTFHGEEAKQVYDFSRGDDALVHAGGDDITFQPLWEPSSFWFRALPGHTAAFRTQTTFGRYHVNSIVFNYEIAPLDRTFQVWLVYCNGGKLTQRRIDDGIYRLGRQQFRNNQKVVVVDREVEDFQIVFRKGNRLTGTAASDDWLLLGNLVLDLMKAS